MVVTCNYEDCERTWDRDPVLEVPCPTCEAGVGEKCKRPSGHGGNFVHPHASRDIKADNEGCYGECPHDRCGQENNQEPTEPEPDRDPEQIELGAY